ncbi:putative DNA repair protein (Rad57) [Aspergillus clavatus NRRL 1]|uniref:DNA repair protein (Rad57), putative n=1 Tax=Aspergillus clavatus (strain ATCC 1007 / CBS 513.65 / DSM 816 / NCTC 3887 / NRRL 1 / QM 1276 / 107) TaxID=344612 RepID=A1CPK9_ASPCL|nr:DNA repair protein (Rad57), putative [Aspergillus clavatus NRRL 1]EAW07580.1 DNA repair protein (Rad57), putative [Aspergillus clavatus NRRL 1]
MALDPLKQIGQGIFLYEHTADEAQPSSSDPSLIILCTWLGGASPRRINRYVTRYRALFPGSSVLVITTTLPDITIRTFGAIRARLKPARDAICRLLGPSNTSDKPPSSRRSDALLHIFSQGGCNTAIQLALSMKENKGPSALSYLPLRGVIFDCCPGDVDFQRSYKAAAVSLPEGGRMATLARRAALYAAVGTIVNLQDMGFMSSVRDLRHQLNDEAVLGRSVRRLYLFSEADEIVDWRDVQSHMETARGDGYYADGVRFRRSPHCALMLEDETKYWTSVEQFWKGEELSYTIDDLELNSGDIIADTDGSVLRTPRILPPNSQRVVCSVVLPTQSTLMDLLSVLPGFQTKSYAHIIPPLERNKITTVDLITLDTLEIAKRAHVPPADLRRLTAQVVNALHKDLGFEEVDTGENGSEPSSSIDVERPLVPGPLTKLDLSCWNAISTLDPTLDELLNGGVPVGYLTEVTGESGSGKTQFLLGLLLAVQLPEPRGLGKGAIYISTEAALATSRLSQLLESHPYLSTLPEDRAPTLENILSINAMDLETQDHILNYQLPVAITRYNVGLVVIDSITANYRAEHTSHNVQGLSTRSSELAKLGQLLRNLATAHNIAIVVANQVSDRFDPLETNPTLLRTAAYGNTVFSSSPAPTQPQGPPTPLRRENAASPRPPTRSRFLEPATAELSPQILLPPPSSSPAFPSSPFVSDDQQQQQQPDFDGSYLVGNAIHNELLDLVHQQRFFTGWGDESPPTQTNTYPSLRQPSQKTPALGFVWTTQIACRIALKKQDLPAPIDPPTSPLPRNTSKDAVDHPSQTPPTHPTPEHRQTPSASSPAPVLPDRTIRRTMKLAFAPWSAGTVACTTDEGAAPVQHEVEYTIWKGGLKGVQNNQ